MGFSRQEHWSGLPFPSPKGTIERKKVKSLSHVQLFATPWTPWNFPGRSTELGCHFLHLLQNISKGNLVGKESKMSLVVASLFFKIFYFEIIIDSSPWMEEPGGLQSVGSQRVGHNWATSLSFYSSFWRRKWQPTPVFVPGESHGQRGVVGYSLWGCKESDTTKQPTHTQLPEKVSITGKDLICLKILEYWIWNNFSLRSRGHWDIVF